jgi:hypothetical protein
MCQSITPSRRRPHRKVLHRPLEETGSEAPLKTENLAPMAQRRELADSRRARCFHYAGIVPHCRFQLVCKAGYPFERWLGVLVCPSGNLAAKLRPFS